MENLVLYKQLGMAMLAGLLIGMGRSWTEAKTPPIPFKAEQDAVPTDSSGWAGMRTFTLIGLLGGLSALIGSYTAPWVIGMLLAAFILFAGLIYHRYAGRARDWGTTTLVASLVTFSLGLLSFRLGAVTIASLAAIVVVILETKSWQHGLVNKVHASEFSAFLKLLVLSIVLIPLLPNKGYGPGSVLNPFEIGLMIALISAITFFGHFAIRIYGPRAGPLIMGLFGGLASSTALTVAASRMAHLRPPMSRALSAGIAMAIAVMLVRTTVLLSIISLPLLYKLLPPFIGGVVACACLAIILYKYSTDISPALEADAQSQLEIAPPSDIGTAVQFGVILALVLLLSYFAQYYLGASGLYLVSFISGFVDVDAVTITMARMSEGLINPQQLDPLRIAILVAITTNSVTKLGICLILGGRPLMYWTAIVVTTMLSGMAIGGLFF